MSSHPVLAAFIRARQFVPTPRVSYDDGPVAIQNPSQGLLYQIWRARYVSDTVYLVAPNYTESVFFKRRCIESISLSFDQNGRPLLTYLIAGNLYLYWHHTITQKYEHTLIDTQVTSHQVCLDIRTRLGILDSQVVLGYTKNNNLYYVLQADRYMVPYLIALGVNGYLIQIGMSRQHRFQFLVEANEPGVYTETFPWGEVYAL